jgi:nuclear-control-of-ATPase protein 2
VDFALSGIDKLLRSQELTFGFVGVAPALAVVYLVSDWLLDIWRGGKGKGKFGGKKERTKVWNAMRRIEKLLIVQPKMGGTPQYNRLFTSYSALGLGGPYGRTGFIESDRQSSPRSVHLPRQRSRAVPIRSGDQEDGEDDDVLSPLTNGLLLLASTQLRTFADAHLSRSDAGFKDQFLEDVKDLEDGWLSARQKRDVVGRMWRSWGRVLGWDNLAYL